MFEQKEDVVELKKASVLNPDGTSQIVYVPVDKNQKFKDRLTIVYTVVGIIAVSLTAYLSIKQLKKR
jgi:hypothetical protein